MIHYCFEGEEISLTQEEGSVDCVKRTEKILIVLQFTIGVNSRGKENHLYSL